MTRRFNDPDDTDGRALYRAIANAEARRSLGMARKVKMRAPDDIGRPVSIHHGPVVSPTPPQPKD